MIIDNGAYPSPLGYCGFPKSVCTSVNECICHGIPDSRPLEVSQPESGDNEFEHISRNSQFIFFGQDGDIINVDVTVYLNVSHGYWDNLYIC
jgi:methionyl aminopeptidase